MALGLKNKGKFSSSVPMTIPFPTLEDVTKVCDYVDAETLRVAQPESNAATGGSPALDTTAEDAPLPSSQCRELLESTLLLAQRAAALFNVVDGPVVAPARFVSQRTAELVSIHDDASQYLTRLKAEGREHGLSFAPLETKSAFFKFVECCHSVEKWTLGALKLSEGRESLVAASKAADVQDVQETYAAFYENSQLFFVAECTLFDPRIQRRILMPPYFAALRDHAKQLFREVERLKAIDAAIRPSIESRGSQLLFRPSISEFQFLYESLQMYLAVSILEDDITTTTYFRILLETLQREATQIADTLSHLPKAGEHASMEKKGGVATAPTSTSLSPTYPSAAAAGDGAVNLSRRPSASAPAFSESDLQHIRNVLATFDDVRHKVTELRKAIHSDIAAKDVTHRTRVPGSKAPQPATAQPAQTQQQRQQQASTSWWDSMKSAATKFIQGATDVVTCKAEVFSSSDDTDADGAPLSRTSPMSLQKSQLEAEATLLEQALDAVADGLEVEYPDVYQKDWKSSVQKSAARVFSKLESMTVVFSGGK